MKNCTRNTNIALRNATVMSITSNIACLSSLSLFSLFGMEDGLMARCPYVWAHFGPYGPFLRHSVCATPVSVTPPTHLRVLKRHVLMRGLTRQPAFVTALLDSKATAQTPRKIYVCLAVWRRRIKQRCRPTTANREHRNTLFYQKLPDANATGDAKFWGLSGLVALLNVVRIWR